MESIENILVVDAMGRDEVEINRTRLIDQVFVCYMEFEFLKCNSFNSVGIFRNKIRARIRLAHENSENRRLTNAIHFG